MPLIAVGGGNRRRDPPRQSMEGRPVARIEPASTGTGDLAPWGSVARLQSQACRGGRPWDRLWPLGLLTSFVAPRGPTTTANALFVMAVGLLLGTAGGALVAVSLEPRRRSSVVYVVGIEAGSRSTSSASSLDVRLDIPYGVVAFVLARGRPFLLALPPIVLRRSGRDAPWRGDWAGRRVSLGGGYRSVPRWSVLVVAGLAVLVAWPASTPPVLGPNGHAGRRAASRSWRRFASAASTRPS